MLSRSTRIVGAALAALAAVTTLSAPAHAADTIIADLQIPHELQVLCVPDTGFGVPLVDGLVKEVMGCRQAAAPRRPAIVDPAAALETAAALSEMFGYRP
ncbi:MAG TPA: hypothetical protein VFV66_18430 [Nonomuraea sp.]|nr:hypothetical protein [Nonomuraea sp.]